MENNAKYRHVKRGTEYTVLGEATVQAGRGIHDYDTVVVYRDESGELWVRPREEFYDGRFEEVK